ncbi:MAG: hypothetical protein HYV27_18510 [Candidatus Hydrogenedentes bacterium]|nr:hypothetical protein [Candidatus Hydrogenedentota bacterium]
MDRRAFLTTGTQAALAGGLLGGVAFPAAGVEVDSAIHGGPLHALLREYTAEDHRRRLANIAVCTQSIRACMRQHLITEYMPGQCCYNLGEYPSTKPWVVDEYDEQELDRLRDDGIQVLQVFDDWNDSLRLFGGDKYSAVNPEGYRRFIEMAHRRGMKVLTYTSPCFIQRTDPDFQQAWSREGDFLVVGYWNMARCSPASPGWRAFLLQKYAQIMDEYGADGLYVDGGYLANRHAIKHTMPMAPDEIVAFEETPEHDGAFADLLALIYAGVKQRGGILKLHVNAAEAPMAGALKTYDYLWVGEGVASADPLRETVKNYVPYIVPCLDMGFTTLETEDEPYLHAIPYMQFPVTAGGRIFTGERGFVPGIKYNDDFWMQRCRDAWKQYQEDPSKLYTHSAWDAVPGNPNARALHGRWLKRYLPMVEAGTWAWLEVKDSTLFATPLPEGVVASAFANRDLHLVVANYGREAVEVSTAANYVDTRTEVASTTWKVAARSLVILRREA